MPVETTKRDLQQIGNYDLVQKIAEGGMGTVYKGRHRLTGQIVAVKLVPVHMTTNTVFMKRFEQEYNAAKALDHPNVVKAIEFGKDCGTPFLVMEYVEGESVGQKLERVGRLDEAEAIKIIGQVAQALHKAHKVGLIHRDVKPDNILLMPDGLVKIVDLGLVKEIDADLNLTRTNRGLGTPHFMAPEQFRNAKNADALCDIYSMAASMYMMVTGALPFESCAFRAHGLGHPAVDERGSDAARRLVPRVRRGPDGAKHAQTGDLANGRRCAPCRHVVSGLQG
jgi:serine/threonine protein kinase